jgi:hypothetical protein
MKDKTIIGLSGFAGSGKDLFCEVLCERRPEFQRKSLADELKLEVRDKILEENNIDILSCSREEKDLVRHKLVEHAKEKRSTSKGRYWLNKLDGEVRGSGSPICITDVRYDDYDHDELHWLINELGGVLVHIQRWDIINNNKKYFEGPNEEERRNEPRLKSKATYNLEWPSFKGDMQSVKYQAGGFVDEFLVWLDRYNEKVKGQSIDMEGEGEEV